MTAAIFEAPFIFIKGAATSRGTLIKKRTSLLDCQIEMVRWVGASARQFTV